ncbi:uncharacterized protein LTR77_000686 [Saxophila tyrrhenica]|uniref:Uncharacterized protein n=1 Tax=Saxophila tyrrhenica TaxID=1690608 RepID=A0AAV9PP11_9PEZI|nr:hypothetical protein LTR77_000686 [Saxophila tyrrhenica]
MDRNNKDAVFEKKRSIASKRRPSMSPPEDSTAASPASAPTTSPYFKLKRRRAAPTSSTSTSTSPAPAPAPTTPLAGSKRKASTSTTPSSRPNSTPKSSTHRSRIPHDPINISVYELRKEGLGWDEITHQTNASCGLTGVHELTGPACYSRFTRNGPLVAKDRGEEYQRGWYMNMKGPVAFEDREEGGEDQADDGMGSEGPSGEQNSTLEGEEDVMVRSEYAKAAFWKTLLHSANAGVSDTNRLSEENIKGMVRVLV